MGEIERIVQDMIDEMDYDKDVDGLQELISTLNEMVQRASEVLVWVEVYNARQIGE